MERNKPNVKLARKHYLQNLENINSNTPPPHSDPPDPITVINWLREYLDDETQHQIYSGARLSEENNAEDLPLVR